VSPVVGGGLQQGVELIVGDVNTDVDAVLPNVLAFVTLCVVTKGTVTATVVVLGIMLVGMEGGSSVVVIVVSLV
jgi:hypothetical protein